MPTGESWLAEVEARKDEPLHPDLAEYLEESGFMGPVLKHPLVFDIPYMSMLAWRANDQYEYKRQALAEAMDKGDWHTVVWLHERPYRVAALMEIRKDLRGREYWELLSAVWTDSENIWQNMRDWKTLLTSRKPGRQYMMDWGERRALENKPAVFPVWRGFNTGGTKRGWSWTTSKDKAEWFARRLLQDDERPVLAEARVPKSRVIAYLTGRNEKEIVVDPRFLTDVSTTELTRNT